MKAVYTCITGRYDQLQDPVITEGWDYICFTDNPDLKSDKWQIKLIDLPYGNKKNARFIKINSHLLDYDFTLWIDAAIKINCDLDLFVLDYLKSPVTMMMHPWRKKTSQEYSAVIKGGYDLASVVNKQKSAQVFPDNLPLCATGVIWRKRCKDVEKFNKLWWKQVKRFSHRDQLSVNFAQYKSGIKINLIPYSILDKKLKHMGHISEYQKACQTKSDINEHLPTLLMYALKCDSVTEFGVRTGVSTWAFIESGKPVKCYDIKYHPLVNRLTDAGAEFIEADTLKVEIEETDLLFIDTLHTYDQLSKELQRHAAKVNKYIILHDTETYGYKDEPIYAHASKAVKKTVKQGLWEAIRELKGWRVKEHYKNNNGLTILERKENNSLTLSKKTMYRFKGEYQNVKIVLRRHSLVVDKSNLDDYAGDLIMREYPQFAHNIEQVDAPVEKKTIPVSEKASSSILKYPKPGSETSEASAPKLSGLKGSKRSVSKKRARVSKEPKLDASSVTKKRSRRRKKKG